MSKNEITLVGDMSQGYPDGDSLGLIMRSKAAYKGDKSDSKAVIAEMAKGLSSMTGFNFDVDGGFVGESAKVVWSPKASFIAGLGTSR